jgi:tubulin beta
MGNKFGEVLFDVYGIGGSGDYCGEDDAHLGHINVFYHEALGGKYALHAMFFYLQPGVIVALNLSLGRVLSLLRCVYGPIG